MGEKDVEVSGKNGKPLILLVDNDRLNVKILQRILNTGEYSFIAAFSGYEALAEVKKKLPDLILLDIMMDDIDGFEICKRLKENPTTTDIPVIFLSAKEDIEDKVRGFKLGAVDYITKPFQSAEILARVHTHVKLKKYTDMIKEYNHQMDETLNELVSSYSELLNTQDETIKREKQAAVKAMAVTANHEINQPLTLITGYLELLRQSLPPDNLTKAQKKYLDKIEYGLQKILEILGRFRKSAHIDFGEYLPNINMVVFDGDSPIPGAQ